MKLAPPTGKSNEQLHAWAKRLTDDLNRFVIPIEALPVFSDDAAAAAGSLDVRQPYVATDGQVRRRAT